MLPKDIGWGWYELTGLFALVASAVITAARVLRRKDDDGGR